MRPEFILRIHDLYLGRYGGFPGIRDQGVLHASAWRARWKWRYEGATIAECAAAYAYAFATAHAFHDGNKRTAFYAAVAFLVLNGYELVLETDGAGRDAILDVAMRRWDEAALARWFEKRVRQRPGSSRRRQQSE